MHTWANFCGVGLLPRPQNCRTMTKDITKEDAPRPVVKVDNNDRRRNPIHYTVFHPNVLIGANTELKLAEQRLYMEILNFNHQSEPDRLDYDIPYEYITHSTDRKVIQKKAHQEFTRIAEVLQKRVFRLDKEFMQAHFNEKYAVTINPFPVIKYKEKNFQVRLNEYFKAILVKLETGFTKGDIELLRTFRSEYSYLMYWLIRREQWKHKAGVLDFALEDLKKELGCTDQYEGRFNNFKARVLDVVYEEFQGTWVEFDYEIVRGGKGGKAIQKILFKFGNDFQQEQKLALAEKRFAWEEDLLQLGISEKDVLRFRDYVVNQQVLKEGVYWDSFYVQACLSIARENYRNKRLNLQAKKIANMANYVYSALVQGWWAKEVAFRRELARRPEQPVTSLFELPAKRKSAPPEAEFGPSTAVLVAPEVAAPPRPKFQLPYTEFTDTYRAYLSISKEPMNEADFAAKLGYKINGDVVEKV
jgi:plasmid replication initiation protein